METSTNPGGTLQNAIYKLHRVAPNSEGWVRPSVGRLGEKGVGQYVEEHGFGHEDWNFNFRLASGGKMQGYTVAKPAAKFDRQEFGVILATYDSSGWKAVGYYNGARVTRDVKPKDAALRQMAEDVLELAKAKSSAHIYVGKSLSTIKQILRKNFEYHYWITPKNQVFVFEEPVIIPTQLFSPGTQRMTCSNNITEQDFYNIIELGDTFQTRKPNRGPTQPQPSDAINDLGTDAPDQVIVTAFAYARDPKIRDAVKKRAKGKCEFCGALGFKGKGGRPYLECHHIIALANEGTDRMTNVIALCPNDHREAHFGERSIEIEKKMIKKVLLLEGKATAA